MKGNWRNKEIVLFNSIEKKNVLKYAMIVICLQRRGGIFALQYICTLTMHKIVHTEQIKTKQYKKMDFLRV